VSRRYQLTPEATAQVDAIGSFIANDSIDAALKVFDALEEAFEQLAAMPDMGHMREDLTDRPVRFWTVFSYRIVYDPTTVPLQILAVWHGARDIERLVKEM
jgi:toxin ParE1/3/4